MTVTTAVDTAVPHRSERPARPLLKPPHYLPPPPRSLNDLGVPENMLIDLALRHINTRGLVTIQLLAHMLKLPIELAEMLFRHLSEQHYLEVRRMSGDDYVFSLSPAGRKLAMERAF